MSTLREASKEDIIFELLLSLNRGNSGSSNIRVQTAINQFNDLVENGLYFTKAQKKEHLNKSVAKIMEVFNDMGFAFSIDGYEINVELPKGAYNEIKGLLETICDSNNTYFLASSGGTGKYNLFLKHR
jgi:hypothetical protein